MTSTPGQPGFIFIISLAYIYIQIYGVRSYLSAFFAFSFFFLGLSLVSFVICCSEENNEA